MESASTRKKDFVDMSADIQLPPSYENLFEKLDQVLPEHDKAILMKNIISKCGFQLEVQKDLQNVMKKAYSAGYIDDGDSAERFLSSMADKTSSTEKIDGVVKQYKPSLPVEKYEVFGRGEDIKEVKNLLLNPNVPGINLFGESGVGKTTLAKEVSKQFEGFKTLTVDLRDIKDMETVYVLTLLSFGYRGWDFSVDKIYEYFNEKLAEKNFVIFDNVEQVLIEESQSKEELTGFLQRVSESNACKNQLLKFILTSQCQINEPFFQMKAFAERKVKPLEKEVSKGFIKARGRDVLEVSPEENDKALFKISELCRGIPYLLQGAEQLMRQNFCTPVQVWQKITTQTEKGVPEEFACFKALFHSLPSDHLRQLAVKISLLRRPFSVSTAMKIAEISSDYDARWDLEMLVNHKIITAEDVEGKRNYDLHALFREFVTSHLCEKEPVYKEQLKKGEHQLYVHFSGKLTKLAQSLEAEFVETYSKLERNRANFELAFDISQKDEENIDLLLHSDEYNKFVLMGILFEVLKKADERQDRYKKWAEKAENQENWRASALMRCWQSVQNIDSDLIEAESTLKTASESIKKAEVTASPEQINEITSLYLHCSGKIKYYQAINVPHASRRTKEKGKLLTEGIKDLKEAISMRNKFMEDNTLTSRGLGLIGNCYLHLDNPEEALKNYQEAMEMKKRLVGTEDHWEFPAYYNQIGQVHDMIGRKKEEKWYKSFFGPRRARKKKYEKAAEWMEKALELQEDLEVSGTDHTATFQRNLANIYIGLQIYDKALEYAQMSYKIRNKRLGKHPETVRILYLIGVIHEWRKDLKAALQSYEKAFEMEESLPEDQHSIVRKLLCDRLETMKEKLKKNEKLEEYAPRIKLIKEVFKRSD